MAKHERNYMVRCPDCEFERVQLTRPQAAALTGRSACPNCDRGMGFSVME